MFARSDAVPTLTEGDVRLRPLRLSDATRWQEIRRRNQAWLGPWDATVPDEGAQAGEIPPNFPAMVRRLRAEARAGRVLPWVVEFGGRMVGQVTVGGVTYGSLRSAYIGYWIDQEFAGRGITTMAVAMASDYSLTTLRLHRLELNIRPENAASLAVAEKLGYRKEGFREKYLHIDGDWRDHLTYVLIAGDVPGGIVARLRDEAAHQQ
jgi:ribosomal-protein-alanine N-acetyltransferase